MFSVFYAVLLAGLLCYLALNVIKARYKNRVTYLDGGVDELVVARTAHSNAVEYIPIALLLLFGLELNGAQGWLVHLLGILFVLGRVVHARSILVESLPGRKKGMQLTLYTIMALMAANLFYLPYSQFMHF